MKSIILLNCFIFYFHIFYYGNSSIFDIKTYSIAFVEDIPENALFGLSFDELADENEQNVTKILIGAPFDICLHQARCGGVYSCTFFANFTFLSCVSISITFDNVKIDTSKNSMFGFYVEHYPSLGTLICAPMAHLGDKKDKPIIGWCGMIKLLANSTNLIVKHIYNDIPSIMTSSLGYSSTFVDEFESLAVSDVAWFQGRGQSNFYDKGMEYLSRNILGYKSYTFTGLQMKSIQLNNDSSTAHILYSGVGKKGRNVFMMELRKSPFCNTNQCNKLISEIYEIPTDEAIKNNFGQIGYQILTTDIDGDGWDDLLVSSPYSHNDAGLVSQIIIQRDAPTTLFKEVPTLTGDGLKGCLFGFSLAKIDDFNGDNIKDLAISAPFCDFNTGGGKVYIFQSRQNLGFSNTYVQKIHASSFDPFLYSFGMMIKGSIDVNHDGRNDLIISAPLSNRVMVLKREKVAFTHITIHYPSNIITEGHLKKCEIISTGETVSCFEIFLYFKIHNDDGKLNTFEILYSINVDLDHNRSYIIEQHDTNQIILTAGEEIKKIYHMAFYKSFHHFDRLISFTIQYSAFQIVNSNTEYYSIVNMNPNPFVTEFSYRVGCWDEINCAPDLVLNVESDLLNDQFTTEISHILNVSIVNLMGDAINPTFSIIASPYLELSHTEDTKFQYSKEIKPHNSEYIAKIPYLGPNQNVYVLFQLTINSFEETNHYINLTVNCENESNFTQNRKTLQFKSKIEPNMDLLAIIDPVQISMNETNISGQHNNTISLSYFIENHNKKACNKNVVIFVPYITNNVTLVSIYGIEINDQAICNFNKVSSKELSSKIRNFSDFTIDTWLNIDCQISSNKYRFQTNIKILFITNNQIFIMLNSTTSLRLNFYTEYTILGYTISKISSVIILDNTSNSCSEKFFKWMLVLPPFLCIGGILFVLLIIIIIKRKEKQHPMSLVSFKKLIASYSF